MEGVRRGALAVLWGDNGEPYLHLWCIRTLFTGHGLGILDSHVQVILVCHGDHVTVILDLNLEILADTELLANGLDKVAHGHVWCDKHITGVACVDLDPDLTGGAATA